MCISGNIGARIKVPRNDIGQHEYLFSEDQSRYLIEVREKNLKEVSNILQKNSVYYEKIGITQKENLDIDKEFKIILNELTEVNTNWFKNYFNGKI